MIKLRRHTKKRCPWVDDYPLYIKYHDEEWGVPVHSDQKIFEYLTLETFQAGLSWRIILNKRLNFEKAFANFDPNIVAKYGDYNRNKLLANEGIIRNIAKINAVINNARQFLEIQYEFGSFDKYIWDNVDGRPVQNTWKKIGELPTRTKLSDRISKDLKKRGFKFVGSTIIYAHMQATGMVNDHLTNCFRHRQIQKIN